jgi:hypothetical protein
VGFTANFTGDGTVTFADFQRMLDNWNPSCFDGLGLEGARTHARTNRPPLACWLWAP